MEHASEGTLFDYLENCGHMIEKNVQVMFQQLLSLAQYCHQRHIVLWDLKLENIFLDGEMSVKLANFGFSREFTEDKLSTFCGTISYMAPEILQLESYEGPKMDIWSMEVALYRMVTGELPFVGGNF